MYINCAQFMCTNTNNATTKVIYLFQCKYLSYQCNLSFVCVSACLPACVCLAACVAVCRYVLKTFKIASQWQEIFAFKLYLAFKLCTNFAGLHQPTPNNGTIKIFIQKLFRMVISINCISAYLAFIECVCCIHHFYLRICRRVQSARPVCRTNRINTVYYGCNWVRFDFLSSLARFARRSLSQLILCVHFAVDVCELEKFCIIITVVQFANI